MLNIIVTLNPASLDKTLGSIQEQIVRAANIAVDKLGESLVDEAKLTASSKFNLSPHFEDGIQYHRLGPGEGKVFAQVFNSRGTEYANFMEYGNQPVVNNPNLMKFQVDGHWVSTYSRKAISPEHLGFFSEAVDTIREQANNIVETEISNRSK